MHIFKRIPLTMSSALVMTSVLNGCVATEPGEPSSSQSSVNSSVGSVSSSSTTVTSSSVSSVSSSSASAVDLANGKAILEGTKCNACHGKTDDGVYGAGPFVINENNWGYPSKPAYSASNYTGESVEDLARYISERMPSNDIGACPKESCADDVAAYLWSRRGSSGVTPIACETDSPVHYGQRSLKLLTSYEYHNSLQALFNAPLPDDYSSARLASADESIARLPNNKNAKIDETRLNLYYKNAVDLAAWALSEPNALPFSCDDLASERCVDNFIQKFALKAYRRPLSAEETSAFSDVIRNGITPVKGMEWAIATVLSSADFLYRSELGMPVSEVRENGWGLPALPVAGTQAGAYIKLEAEDYTAMSGVEAEETEDAGGGQNIGYIDAGDTLDYDLVVNFSGNYRLSFRVAAENATGAFDIYAGDKLTSVQVASTGGYQTWSTVNKTVALDAGETTLRLQATGAGFNINWLSLEYLSDAPANRVEAEDFTAMSGIQTETTSDVGGGDNIGYTDAGDSLSYSVNLAEGGIYAVKFRIASEMGGGAFDFAGAGSSQAVSVPATGDWQNWQTISTQMTLAGGEHNFDLNIKSAGFNLNWIEFQRLGAVPTQGADNQFEALGLADANAYVLDPYEYASLLAYMYTASSPDDALLKAAGAGDLEDEAKVEAHIERLINSDLGRSQVKRFAGKWLKTDGVEWIDRNHPDFTPQVKASMAESVRRLYEHVFFDESVPFSELFSANYTFLDATLSDFYGISGGGNEHFAFNAVATPGRGGVITSGAFMAFNAHTDETAPIIRSVTLRQNILCQEVPPPPQLGEAGSDREANLAEVKRLEAEGELTNTEKYDLLTKAEGCGDCHNEIINPLFGMDDFDFVGLPRKRVNGLPVQTGLGDNGKDDVVIDWVAKGALYGINSIADVVPEAQAGGGIRFNGAKDLSNQLAEQPAVQNCFIERAYRFGTGYAFTQERITAADKPFNDEQKVHAACVAKSLGSAFNTNNQSPYALYKAMGTADNLRFKK